MGPVIHLEGYPPSYHQAKKSKYDDDDRAPLLKQVRPAYEPPTKAPNQAMYSGGYRPNVHENVQYATPSARADPWQPAGDKSVPYASKTGDGRIEKFDIPRGSEHLRMAEGEKRSRSANRDSRSPGRRDRSPLKDRYRRHSPSPRSPRRSWALEKRRSPDMRDAPPPPLWPGQSAREPEFARSRPPFSDVHEKVGKKHGPTWEPALPDDRDAVRRGPLDDKWKPIAEIPPSDIGHDDRYIENVRDSRTYPPNEDFGRPRDVDRMPYPDKRDFRDYKMKDDREEPSYRRDAPPRRDDFLGDDDARRVALRTNPAELNREIEDVYKRVAELGKRAQQFRKKDGRVPDRDDRFFEEDSGRDRRRDFAEDGSFPARDEDVRPRPSDEADRPRAKESRWSSNTDVVWRPRKPLSPSVKAKRDKAAEELVRRTMNRFKSEIGDHHRARVHDELSLTFTRIFYDMFKDEDVSYIELIIRFNKKFDADGEAKIFEEVMSSFSSGYRKRVAPDESSVPAKSVKRSEDLKDMPKEVKFQSATSYKVPEWNYAPVPPPTAVAPPLNPLQASSVQMQYAVNPATPLVVNPQPSYLQPSNLGFEPMQSSEHSGYNLFLCKEGFLPFEENQSNLLKSFLISQMMEESGRSKDGWAPDFIMKGLQNLYRYEIVTQDERSRDWLLNLDFSNFCPFNVLVYTGEELWYERAAIWLPGHSRCRHIEPLNKLKLQNKKLEGVQIGKWKFVRKVVTTKGTRIYVDMPPSSARALEKHKMMLSYELQKVSVFLKSAAVDKNAFDAGLNEQSVEYVPSIQNCPMPSLNQDTNMVKIGIKGKQMNLNMARKIKYMIIYKLYQYLQQGGSSSTDFLKYGFCSPGFLGIVPENTESRRWLVGLNIGTLNRNPVVVMGGDDTNMKYISMYIMLPNKSKSAMVSALVCEKLKQSNQGVKGLNFSAWKNAKLSHKDGGKIKLEVDMDLESVETLVKLDYELDYVDEGQESLTVVVYSEYSHSELEELIKKYKAEMTDTYDVANMELESESSEDDDVICLGETKKDEEIFLD